MNNWKRRTLIVGAVLAGLVPAAAQEAGEQKLSMARIETVQKPDPSNVQIIFYDNSGRRVVIQTNTSTAQELATRISSIGM